MSAVFRLDWSTVFDAGTFRWRFATEAEAEQCGREWYAGMCDGDDDPEMALLEYGYEVNEETPQHTHDCEGCTFLGRLEHWGLLMDGTRKAIDFDLYTCIPGSLSRDDPTYLARYGSDGPEYASFPDLAGIFDALAKGIKSGQESTYSPALIEAKRRHTQDLGGPRA